MVLTYSTMLDLGTKLPTFELINTTDNQIFNSNSLSHNKEKVIMFISNHCPYVIHYHDQIIKISNEYKSLVEFIAISSNDVTRYPEDSPKKMKELAERLGFNFPYLYDESQDIARNYKAVCTPDFYLFNKNNSLVYRGRLDNSSPGNNNNITGNDLRNAIDNLINGKNPPEEQHPSMGCSIKWK